MASHVIMQGRASAEALMVDTAKAYRLTGKEITNPVTGKVEKEKIQVYPDPGWSPEHPWAHGPVKFQTWEGYESNPKGGGHEFTIQRYQAHFPVGSFAPEVGMIIEAQSSSFDPNIVGREYSVKALLHKSLATAYRLGISEDTA